MLLTVGITLVPGFLRLSTAVSVGDLTRGAETLSIDFLRNPPASHAEIVPMGLRRDFFPKGHR